MGGFAAIVANPQADDVVSPSPTATVVTIRVRFTPSICRRLCRTGFSTLPQSLPSRRRYEARSDSPDQGRVPDLGSYLRPKARHRKISARMGGCGLGLLAGWPHSIR